MGGHFPYAYASWTAIEDFIYSNNTSISGENGGSGWSEAWTLGGGTVKSMNAPASPASNHVLEIDGSSSYAYRHATSITSGTLSIYIRTTKPTSNDAQTFIRIGNESDVSLAWLRVQNGVFGGHLNFLTSTNHDIGTIAADTWYHITIELNDGSHANQMCVSFEGGACSWYATAANYTSVSLIEVQNDSTDATAYIDDIDNAIAGGGGTTPPTTITEATTSPYNDVQTTNSILLVIGAILGLGLIRLIFAKYKIS